MVNLTNWMQYFEAFAKYKIALTVTLFHRVSLFERCGGNGFYVGPTFEKGGCPRQIGEQPTDYISVDVQIIFFGCLAN